MRLRERLEKAERKIELLEKEKKQRECGHRYKKFYYNKYDNAYAIGDDGISHGVETAYKFVMFCTNCGKILCEEVVDIRTARGKAVAKKWVEDVVNYYYEIEEQTKQEISDLIGEKV